MPEHAAVSIMHFSSAQLLFIMAIYLMEESCKVRLGALGLAQSQQARTTYVRAL